MTYPSDRTASRGTAANTTASGEAVPGSGTAPAPRRPQWPAELALWALFASVPWIAPDHVLLFSQIAILALFALSLDLLTGHAGIVSLGHAAFFGIGAYTAALLALAGWEEPLTGLAAAIAAAGLAGLVMAPLVVRMNGLTQLMMTLSLSLLLHEAASRMRGVTGGDDGLSGFMIAPVFGIFEFDLFGITAYGYALCVTAAGFLLYSRAVASPFGHALRGLRQNPVRMAALGTPGRRRLVQAYVMAACLAGAAGALLAQTTQSVALEALGFQRSAEVLIVLILGGVGHRYGGIAGAAIYVLARDWISATSPQYWMGWLGVLMVLVVLVAPHGVTGFARRLAGRAHRRTASTRPGAAIRVPGHTREVQGAHRAGHVQATRVPGHAQGVREAANAKEEDPE